MTKKILMISGFILLNCDNAVKRDQRVVQAENFERAKPLLLPIGGMYLDSVALRVQGKTNDLEFDSGEGYKTWPESGILLTQNGQINVRNLKQRELKTTETYSIVKDFPRLRI